VRSRYQSSPQYSALGFPVRLSPRKHQTTPREPTPERTRSRVPETGHNVKVDNVGRIERHKSVNILCPNCFGSTVCGETNPADEYARGRGTCRSCRRAQQREHDRRVALAEEEEPHPEPSVDQWLVERGLAERRDGELVATDAGRELGAVFGE
jgi:hypothetical protein